MAHYLRAARVVPILSYLCYVDMWEEVSRLVVAAGCTLSVYADDLTISGDVVPEAAIWEIKKILKMHGHRFKKSKEQSKRLKPVEITGVILKLGGLHAPNRQHKKLHEVRSALSSAKSANQRSSFGAQVRGRETQMNQIMSRNSRDYLN